MCCEQCVILVQIYINFYLFLSQTEWQNMIISVAKSVWKKQNNILTTENVFFFSQHLLEMY